MGVKLVSSSAGSVELVAPVTASNYTATMPAKTGTVAMDGPAFSAYLPTTNQSVTSGVWTKVTCSAEEFDTNSNYDKDTNYRFTPTVAGYYQVNGGMWASGGAITQSAVGVYKNGSLIKAGNIFGFTQTAQSLAVVSTLVYLNGSTDYVEMYAYVTASSSPAFNFGAATTYFNGSMVRGA